tara:strand:+ start:10441 stop:11016 length:576 start_codon:yes stop_codon:yes gene_type:complete
MKRIGITGSIGSGKTYVSKVFKSLGVPVFNSDLVSKNIISNSPLLKCKLESEFGNDIYLNNKLDTKKLASIVFSNKSKLTRLNSLIHPLVKESFLKWISLQNNAYIIKEAAIMFESNSAELLDAVICVSSPKDLRINRTINRDKISRKEVLNRMNNQYSQEKKEFLSDYIILNDNKNLILPQVIKIHSLFS